MPPALAEIEGDDVAADLAHQVSQQGRRQPFPVRQVGAVLAHDGRQGAQVPFAGHHRSHHGAPPDNATPAAPTWPSADRRMAAMRLGLAHWHPIGKGGEGHEC